MNESTTAGALIRTAREVFAQQGFAGSSVREITAAAGANLGAITYHFGSKQALYEAVLEDTVTPFRRRLAAAAETGGEALDRIEGFLREALDHMAEHPALPRLLQQQLAAGPPLPPTVKSTMRANIGTLAKLIRDGQREGTIRDGDPRLMAFSVGGQPIMLALLRDALSQSVGLDQDDPTTRARLAESVVRFVRAGLALKGSATA
ncbi:MAG: TetR/AcrR family transcriptional regulator [Gemmatimonadales bacterium]